MNRTLATYPTGANNSTSEAKAKLVVESDMGLLTTGNTNVAIDLKKGGLCKLDAEPGKYGRCAVLN